ncbi:MAG: histidine phosphatase family protein [Bacteroidota bacterium]
MKRIYFVRHAKSSWDHPELSDHDRPLNKRGIRDAPLMAQLLVARGHQLDGLVSSTAKRAWSTALVFADACQIEEAAILSRSELYHASPSQIIEVIRQLPEDWHQIALFGHNPGFTDLANRFKGDYIDNVPTCGIVCAQSEVTSWGNWKAANCTRPLFYYPKQFKS